MARTATGADELFALPAFSSEVRDPGSRSHLQNLRASKPEPVGIGSFGLRRPGLRNAHRCQNQGQPVTRTIFSFQKTLAALYCELA